MLRSFLLAIFFIFSLPTVVLAVDIIRTFDSDIEIKSNSTFTVTENILYDFGEEEKYGIDRELLRTHQQKSSSIFSDRYVDIEVISVTQDDISVPYEVSETRNQVSLRIGDPEKTITGIRKYSIQYAVNGGFTFYDYGDAEIYWNVTGFGWNVPILRSNIRVFSSEDILVKDRACYVGYEGDTTSCTISTGEDGVNIFSARDLGPGAGITVAQGIDRNKVEEVILERVNIVPIALVVLGVWFLVLAFAVYSYRTAHRTGRAIVAQYEPYADFKPMYTGLLFDGKLDSRDITAGLVYLAQQGFLKIKKTETKVLFFFEVDDYEITLLKEAAHIDSPFLSNTLGLLFGSSSTKGDTVALSELKKNLSQQRENQETLKNLKIDLEKDLEENGFFQIHIPTAYIGAGMGVLIVGGIILFNLLISFVGEVLIVGAIGVVGTAILLAFMYRRRTRKGYKALDHLEGFMLFLETTEKDRYEFHNAPEKNPEQFMEFLPYAIAFGVEEKWAEVFKNITIPDPGWYDGGVSSTSFSAINMTSSLGAFSEAFTASSGSSGTSGSSGGGFSGGGGGGGGGGSW